MGVQTVQQVTLTCDACGDELTYTRTDQLELPDPWRIFDLDMIEELAPMREQRSKQFVVNSKACFQQMLIELTDRVWKREAAA